VFSSPLDSVFSAGATTSFAVHAMTSCMPLVYGVPPSEFPVCVLRSLVTSSESVSLSSRHIGITALLRRRRLKAHIVASCIDATPSSRFSR